MRSDVNGTCRSKFSNDNAVVLLFGSNLMCIKTATNLPNFFADEIQVGQWIRKFGPIQQGDLRLFAGFSLEEVIENKGIEVGHIVAIDKVAIGVQCIKWQTVQVPIQRKVDVGLCLLKFGQ